MTRRLEARLEELENSTDDEGAGPPGDAPSEFLFIKIGGDPTTGGHYVWSEERGAYINEDGHERPLEDAPTGSGSGVTLHGDALEEGESP